MGPAMRGPYDVWAPRPERVRLLCGDNAGGSVIEMQRGDDDWWTPADRKAFEARTGASRWGRTLDHVFTDPCQTRPSRPGFWAAPALVNGVLYAASPDGNVYELTSG